MLSPDKILYTSVVMVAQITSNQSGAEKDDRLDCFENNALYCSPNPRWHLEKSSQSGSELKIQDGGAHESRPYWKAAHQPGQRIWDRSHRFPWQHKSRKNVTQLGDLQCPVVLNSRGPSRMRP